MMDADLKTSEQSLNNTFWQPQSTWVQGWKAYRLPALFCLLLYANSESSSSTFLPSMHQPSVSKCVKLGGCWLRTLKATNLQKQWPTAVQPEPAWLGSRPRLSSCRTERVNVCRAQRVTLPSPYLDIGLPLSAREEKVTSKSSSMAGMCCTK